MKKELPVVRHAFAGWGDGGNRPLNRTAKATQYKIKEGKTQFYEVTYIPKGNKERHFTGKYQTLAVARKHAHRIVSNKEGAASEIFRHFTDRMFADGTRNRRRMENVTRINHIETWVNYGDRIRIEEY